MNPIKKLTLQSLRMNRKRSIMTILGIALSCALIVAVVGMLSSAQATIIQHAKETNGDFHALYGGVPEENLHLITDRDDVESIRVIRHAGYAVAEESENEYKPYYYLLTMDKETMEAAAFRLREGRFPENENEVLVSAHIGYNGGITLREGETLTLAVGTRTGYGDVVMSQHAPYDPEAEEKIKDTTEHTFTIVGIMDRPSYLIEQYDAPGYTIVTCDPEGRLADLSADKKLDVQVTFTSAAAARTGVDEIIQTLWDGEVPVDSMVVNNDLIRFSGGLNEELLLDLWLLIGIIIAIILVTSVFVIRNSFRISVSEKTRQYGLLATVGATRKQIRKSVLHEGFLLGAIGIPLGLVIGAVAVRILILLLEIIIGDRLANNLHFVFSLSWIVFVAAVLLSALTIFLSCLIPAQVASRIPPIEAIRGNRDVNLKHGKLKSSPVIRKLFGIGGVIASNNLKRSRKKYRTTVVSLVVSITVFVGLSFFTEALRRSVSYVYVDVGYNLFLWSDADRYDEIAAKIGVTDYAYYYVTEGRIRRDLWGSEYANEFYDSFREAPDYNGWMMCEENENPVYVVFYNSDYFRRYLEEIGAGVNADPATVGVLFDKETLTEYNEKGNVLGMRTKRYTTAKAGDSMEVSLLFPGEAALEEDVEYRSYVLTGNGTEREDESIVKQSVTRTIQIVSVDAKRPMGIENTYFSDAVLMLSGDALPKGETKLEQYGTLLYLNAEDPEETERKIAALAAYPEDGIEIEEYVSIYDGAEETRRFILIIEIFLYGFITVITLIGVTNIFNTITTNMMLRSREFAMLKSVGMTKGQCNRMIMLESLLYGGKSLVIGLPLGVLLAYGIYAALANSFDDSFFVPWNAVGIAVVAVFIIVGLTMWYSLAKINKQNIIETIRSEAV
ncbi:MAG: ABC transporter permease [Lachnospiraceae bacterium]|nr:ABC transporter permease [Lachnospiraceae bacterium]